MADGSYPGLVSKDRNVNATSNPIYIQLTDGTNALDTTSGALDVNIDNASIVVTATDLDIRDLTQATDSVAIGDGTDTIAIAADGSIAVTDNGTTLSVDDGGGTLTIDGTLTGITNDVNIADGGNVISVDDGGGTLTVDGTVTVTATDLDIRDLSHTTDSVEIGDGTDTLAVNTDGSINVNIVSSVISGEVHDYDTAASVASDGTSNHDYATVNTTFLLKSVIVSGSGSVKFEVQTGPVASLATVAVGFLNGRQGDTKQIFFDPAIEVPATSTGTTRIIRTNRQGAATDVYSTIIGQDI